MNTIRREFIQAHRFIYGSTVKGAAAAYNATSDYMIRELIQLYRTHNRLMEDARQQLQAVDLTGIGIDDAPSVDSSTQPRQEAQEAPQDAATETTPVGIWMDDGSATDSQTARDMISANLEYLEPGDPARAEQLEILEELNRQERPQEGQEAPTTAPAADPVQINNTIISAAADAITAAGYHIESVTVKPAEGPQERPQHVYRVYFTDAPEQPMTVKARTKANARKAANLYRRQWGISAGIDRIERDEGELMPF